MKLTTSLFSVLIVVGFAALLAFGSAQMSVPDNGLEDEKEPDASPAPGTGRPPAEPQDGYFAKESGKVSPTRDLEYDWQRVQIKATILGVHFNINQQARSYDSSADDWTHVFHLNAPFKDTDYVSFCAPQTTVTIQVRDTGEDTVTIYEGTLTEVPPCQ